MAELRKVVVCTPGGREIEVDFSEEGTVRALKEQLQEAVGESPARMTLLLYPPWELFFILVYIKHPRGYLKDYLY